MSEGDLVPAVGLVTRRGVLISCLGYFADQLLGGYPDAVQRLGHLGEILYWNASSLISSGSIRLGDQQFFRSGSMVVGWCESADQKH